MPTKLPKHLAKAVGKASSLSNQLSPTESNVLAIASLERDATECRSVGERMGDTIAHHAGRLWFIAAHALWFSGWIIVNSGFITGLRRFDPYPYQFLTFVVSLEAIFLSLFILMSQNRGNKQADSRSHLDLQINLLAEQESTKMLQMLQQICEFHGLAIAKDPDIELLATPTKPESLVKELREKMPGDC